ncbi:HNH endonuclease signature motif containing protein [Candidatus Poriferisodalis sp.]|uniref:HNH endonuclease signature motif containing protein n=1 Tax=Candidatus Poriferisodalis sp. TaxID=3101277 RepID=UPI003B010DE4
MERFERQRKARGAGWRRDHEGMLRLWAKLDPDAGAHVEAALEALRREYWIDDKQVRNGRRTPAQRDADVLAYALAGLTHTDADAAAVHRLHTRARSDDLPGDPPPSRRTTPGNGPAKRTTAECEQPGNDVPEANAVDDEGLTFGRRLPPAQISVLIGLDALRGQTDEMGLTDAGVELPPEVVRRLACDAEIIPMILGGSGGSADAGRCRRTVPLRLRRLLVARDRHGRWPGCHEPPSRCDAHHIWHWLDGGPTNLDNLVLLCHRHHHFLHQHGCKMVPQPDGTWTTVHESERERAPASRRSPRQPRAP